MMSFSFLSKPTWLFFLAWFFVALNQGICEIPYQNCSGKGNFTPGSAFESNRNTLLDSLVSNASIVNFSNASIGIDKDRVYGNFLCYRTVGDCKKCMVKALDTIKIRCSTDMEAIVWEENCQLRYSNESFFGVMDYSSDITQTNPLNITNPDSFREAVGVLMQNLSDSAALNASSNGYALGKRYTEKDDIYGLVQCTTDLSGADCYRCLQNATSHIQTCCYQSMGARVLSRNCYLRYELYSFIEEAATNKQKKKFPTTIIIIIAASTVVVVALFSSWLYYHARGGKENPECVNIETSLHHSVTPVATANFLKQNIQQRDEMKLKDIPLITLATLLQATNHFSKQNILGQGGFGPVYKGVLPDGKEVAVKRLSVISEQGSEEFMNEVLLIMKLQHKNLVKLLGCCIDEVEKILIYEYMPNRSLDAFIFNSKRRKKLDWRTRLNIINGIARGLLYLHQDSRLRIIHRDMKASNVLLDEKLNPKISDFGMARIFGGNIGEANTNIIVGSYGYMAPEYAMEGLYSVKSDVFSFGVLLIEIVTGKKNAGFHLSQLAPSLLEYAWRLWNDGEGLDLMDSVLTDTYSAAVQFVRCIHIGLLCVQEDANTRPNMSSVVLMLENECVPLDKPQRPAFSVGRLANKVHSINQFTLSRVLPR